jgi:integrase
MKPNELSVNACQGSGAFLPPLKESLGARTRRPKVKLSRATVDAGLASWERGTRLRVFFDHPKGLFLNITPGGSAAYYFLFVREDGKRSETVIGAENQLTPALARAKAEQLIAQMTLSGVNPVAAKRVKVAQAKADKAKTFRALTEAFLGAAENCNVAERSVESREGLLNRHILPRIGDNSAADLRRPDIKACLRAVVTDCKSRYPDNERAGHRTANACQQLVGQILNWACDEELISANVIGGMKRLFDDQPESRVGKCDEATIRLAWQELDRGTNDAIGMASNLATRLVMLLGQRPNEIAKAHREDFDFEKLEWRPQGVRTKTRRFRYFVPLTPQTVDLFQRAFGMSPESQWAFANPEDRKQHIKAKTISRHWRRMRARLLKAKAPINSNVPFTMPAAERYGRVLSKTWGSQKPCAKP